MTIVRGSNDPSKIALVHDGSNVILDASGQSVVTRETIAVFDTDNLLDAEIISLGLTPLEGYVAPTPFIITVKTNNVGDSEDDEFEIKAVGGPYSYTTSDGTSGSAITGSTTLTFPSGAGTYQIEIKSDDGAPYMPLFRLDDEEKILDVVQWGTSVKWSGITQALFICRSLTTISATDGPDLTNVSGANFGMFQVCDHLVYLDMTNWIIPSALTDWSYTFNNTGGVSTGVWDDLIGLDLQDWSNISTLEAFLTNASIPTTRYNLLLRKWVVDGVSGILIDMGNTTWTDSGQSAADHATIAAANTLLDGGAA